MTYGERIRQWRKREGATLKVLSERCGISIQYLNDIEHGRRNVGPKTVQRIAAVTGITPFDARAPRTMLARIGRQRAGTWSKQEGRP
jgi:transcriptional regulator with XRE-family HTH domain